MRWITGRPLRVKLTALLVVLLAVGLAVSSVIATAALRSYLVSQVDSQLENGRPFALRVAEGDAPDGGFGTATQPTPGTDGSADGFGGSAGFRPPSRYFFALVATDGTVQVVETPSNAADSTPVIPGIDELAGLVGTPTTVGSETGSGSWRLLVNATPDASGWVVAAYPLADVEATVVRLTLLQLIVGLVVVSAVGALGYLLVRRSLRPLDEITATTATIAEGDLSLRAPDGGTGSEVDTLAHSFNAMVTRIEESFDAQAASEERLRQFVADASHELRTPLTSIRGYAELIETGAAADTSSALQRIEEESERMAMLIDDMLMLARLDRPREPVRQPVDMRELVDAGVAAQRAAAPGRRIEVAAPAGGAVVTGDPVMLRQALDNLVSNAVRYSADDTVVDVVLTRDGAWCELAVVDHGVGLTADEASHVFERLYRTDEARSRVHGGTGLGLAIVQSVAVAHDGSVRVTSVPGEGSTFTLRLPLAG